jgi:hypothetical protein
LAAARAVIYELDTAQETRQLSPREINLRRELKQAVLGLLFAINHNGHTFTEEEAKAEIVFSYYDDLLGTRSRGRIASTFL